MSRGCLDNVGLYKQYKNVQDHQMQGIISAHVGNEKDKYADIDEVLEDYGARYKEEVEHNPTEHFDYRNERHLSFKEAKGYNPKNTIKTYKLFRYADGKIFPLYIDRNKPIPLGKWLLAEDGNINPDTGKVESSIGELAYRPGWHAGTAPSANHIGGKIQLITGDKMTGEGIKPTMRETDTVWAEVEMPTDVDWQSVANSRASIVKSGENKGQLNAKQADIRDQIPFGGSYKYKTNNNMEDTWVISGHLKVNKILSDKEVGSIGRGLGREDLPRDYKLGAKTFYDKNILIENKLADVKSAPVSEEAGATFNWDGSDYEGGGIILPIFSALTSTGKGTFSLTYLTTKKVNGFMADMRKRLVSGYTPQPGNLPQEIHNLHNSTKIGVFKFPAPKGKAPKASIDLNLVLKPEQKNLGILIGKALGQNSLYDIDNNSTIYTGETGDKTIKITPKEFDKLRLALSKNELPKFIVSKLNKGGGPIIDNKGMTLLTHWSNSGDIAMIEPSKHGTVTRGSDWRTKGNNSGDWINFISYGINVGKKNGYHKEDILKGSDWKYTAEIEAGLLYDFMKDPQKYNDEALKILKDKGVLSIQGGMKEMWVRKLLQRDGYKGYYSNVNGRGLQASVIVPLKPISKVRD